MDHTHVSVRGERGEKEGEGRKETEREGRREKKGVRGEKREVI